VGAAERRGVIPGKTDTLIRNHRPIGTGQDGGEIVGVGKKATSQFILWSIGSSSLEDGAGEAGGIRYEQQLV